MYNDELAGLMSRVLIVETLNRLPVVDVAAGLGSRVRRPAVDIVLVAEVGSRFRTAVDISNVDRRSTIGLGSRSLDLLQRLLVEEYLDGFGSVLAVDDDDGTLDFDEPYFDEFCKFNFFVAVVELLLLPDAVAIGVDSFSLVDELPVDEYLFDTDEYVDAGVVSRFVL